MNAGRVVKYLTMGFYKFIKTMNKLQATILGLLHRGIKMLYVLNLN